MRRTWICPACGFLWNTKIDKPRCKRHSVHIKPEMFMKSMEDNGIEMRVATQKEIDDALIYQKDDE